MPQPHDRLFRHAFEEPEHAAALLRTALPAALAVTIDWSTLRACANEFLDPQLGEHRSDRLFVAIDRQGDELYLLLEHKAEPDPGTALQVLGYQLQIWQRWQARHAPGAPLPRILPIVVHHGARPWNAPTTLLQRPADPGHAWTDVNLLVDDFARRDEATILARGLTDRGTAIALFLQVLRTAGAAECWPAVTRWIPLLRRIRSGPDGQHTFRRLLSYALEVSELNRDQLVSLAAIVGDQQDQEMIMSTADKLRAEGLSQGLSQGRVLGRAEALLRQLTQRFGTPSDAVTACVRSASLAELDQWTDRILTAPTLDAVFGHG